jgi:hypothetical protein
MVILNQFFILSRKEHPLPEEQVTQDQAGDKWVLYRPIKRAHRWI